jgi:hypothetical protein
VQLSPVIRTRSRLPQRDISQTAIPTPHGAGPDIGPYVDYCRVLTAEGGVLITYKDLDLRLRHTLWRIFAWTAATGFAGWFIVHHTPLHSDWINFGCLLLVAIGLKRATCTPRGRAVSLSSRLRASIAGKPTCAPRPDTAKGNAHFSRSVFQSQFISLSPFMHPVSA